MTEASTPNVITVTGHGAATSEPDRFTINIGIECRRGTVKDAYAAAGTALTNVRASLLTLAVPQDLIGTSALNVRAETRWQEDTGPIVTGYTVSSTLAVTLDYGSSGPDVIAAAIDAGGNDVRLNGLTPVVSDRSDAVDAARALAWADASHAADFYAELAGRRLGAALSITEGLDDGGTPPAPILARAAKFQSMVPVDPGQSTVTATITVTWQLL
ncbi:SIMPL domain-containing protein [Specibacter cremeus]|uniref:SIMPL domain-containing protein n=1 Tax=Specibacter cremeus TaxID=1629051 RepID=UPI000F77561A|nr:SIMPL domain-containing protein [Specibacter cremeus]